LLNLGSSQPTQRSQNLGHLVNSLPVFNANMNQSAGSILVVDDDIDNVANLSDILDDLGYHPYRAHDGTSALGLVDSQKFDVAIVDYMMPEMNGAELVAEIYKRQPATKPIIVTGYADEQQIANESNRGNLVILRKPVDIKKLLKQMEDSIKR